MSRIAAVFELNRKGFSPRRGAAVLVMIVPLVVLGLLDLEKYWLSVAFGALFVGLCDPGGRYGYRVPRIAVVAVAGAVLTALGFAVGRAAWGWVVLSAFVVTLLAGLAVKYGPHRFAAATLLNVWFLVALALAIADREAKVDTTAWGQALAWLTGAAATIAYTCIVWLIRGRTAQSQPAADVFPGDITPMPLTRPVVLFVVIRAVAVAIAVAIAFGLDLPNADWMPIAALVAMKPSLQQSALVAEQRVAGAILGAAVAALFLLTVDAKVALVAVIVLLGMLAASLRSVNYAWYCTAVTGAVLIGMDIPHPADLADEGRRILFTLIGVAIAVVVMLAASLLGNRNRNRSRGRGRTAPAT
ncbi:FUSC family protein [Actinoplanes sp. CA-030573]|uniref:FUSC family protein n=1 Tax=Actinoplanes sp. CA-030573 TaxID=3239898 RepID=UPI003D8EBC93